MTELQILKRSRDAMQQRNAERPPWPDHLALLADIEERIARLEAQGQ